MRNENQIRNEIRTLKCDRVNLLQSILDDEEQIAELQTKIAEDREECFGIDVEIEELEGELNSLDNWRDDHPLAIDSEPVDALAQLGFAPKALTSEPPEARP